jgi:hypothetical protein
VQYGTLSNIAEIGGNTDMKTGNVGFDLLHADSTFIAIMREQFGLGLFPALREGHLHLRRFEQWEEERKKE